MTKILAILAALSGCVVRPAAAQDVTCRAFADERHVIAAADGVVTELEGSQIQSAGVFFNSVPPETDNVVSSAWLVDLLGGNGVLAVGPDGAICGRLIIPAAAWQKLREHLAGRAV